VCRLKRKGFIERVPGTHTYQVTRYGRQTACFLTKLAARVVVPVLTELDAAARAQPPPPRPVVQAWRAYERRLDEFLIASQVAA